MDSQDYSKEYKSGYDALYSFVIIGYVGIAIMTVFFFVLSIKNPENLIGLIILLWLGIKLYLINRIGKAVLLLRDEKISSWK